MGLQINTNVTALNALRNLTSVNNAVSASTERLSSGLRINHASDDPAGLIISESLRAQIDGLNQAISNSQDAGNVIKTADGGLSGSQQPAAQHPPARRSRQQHRSQRQRGGAGRPVANRVRYFQH